MEKEEQLDLLVAANQERVKKLDKLILREESYRDLEFELRHAKKAYDEEHNKRKELEKLVEAYKKDLERQVALAEELKLRESEAMAAEM